MTLTSLQPQDYTCPAPPPFFILQPEWSFKNTTLNLPLPFSHVLVVSHSRGFPALIPLPPNSVLGQTKARRPPGLSVLPFSCSLPLSRSLYVPPCPLPLSAPQHGVPPLGSACWAQLWLGTLCVSLSQHSYYHTCLFTVHIRHWALSATKSGMVSGTIILSACDTNGL